MQGESSKAEAPRDAGRVGGIAIACVANDWVSRKRCVLADLMRAPSANRQVRDACMRVSAEELVACLRIDTVLSRALRVTPPLRLGRDLLFPHALRGVHAPTQHCAVVLESGGCSERLLQAGNGLGTCGDEHDARRLYVQPVHGRALLADACALEESKQRERPIVHWCAWRLVDHNPLVGLGKDELGDRARQRLAHPRRAQPRMAEQQRGQPGG
mmetsp:Transcript_26892/g.81409  ORF Transcript_26892/g.81409 Transcript_26892/m.81409 type:complete len:214 (-) Transcript_26892:43-684(-)|eukprot:scaffold82207_cov31-Tisochrysis_lutea.AAC.3